MLDDVEPQEVLIAIPSAPGALRGKVVSACRDRGVPVRTMPTVFELLQTGGRLMRQVREVKVEDVLGREPVRMDIERVGDYLTGRCVLVTGAGGSIGSELCRQIARVGPSRLILLDHAEDNLFEIQRELVEDRHALNTVSVLADCKEEERMREVFAEHRPAVVFHAAAYKHVGLMESNPVEAVRNNALAARVMARVAGDSGVRTFILVSTDKAVEPPPSWAPPRRWPSGRSRPPTRASPRRASPASASATCSAPRARSCRSSGARSRPAGRSRSPTRTMTRYFMTIPEAVQLVIRAGSLSSGGEVFVLEMGEAVSILELAKDMIRLSGLQPGRDIAIEIVGRRARREAPRGALQPLRAPAADPGPADPARRPAAHRPRLGGGDLRPHRAAHARGRSGRARRRRRPAREPAARARGARRPDLVPRG